MKTQKGFILPLVIVLLAVLGAGGYIFVKNKNLNNSDNETQMAETVKTKAPASTSADDMASWKTYNNTEFNFELKYPETYIFTESRVGKSFDGSKEFVTIDFKNSSNKLSLQINKDTGGGYGVCKPKVDSTNFVNTYGVKVVKNKFTNYIPESSSNGYICEKIDDVSFVYFIGGPFPKDNFELSGQLVDDKNGEQFERLTDSIVQTFKLIK